MNKILRKAFTVITVVLAISTPRTFAQSSVRFMDSMQIIGSSCVSCHSNFPVNNEQAWAQNGGVISGLTFVIPGDPTNSLLWQRLHGIGGTIMPPSGQLPQTQLDTISNWIANFRSSLANASTRLSVQTGPNIAIAGFIIAGQSQKVVIRGLGPTLSQFGVQGILANPQLFLFNQAGQVIASNDNWQTGNQVNEIQSSGFAPPSAFEPVIIATLPPGKYTAQLRGVNNTTGVALVEVYGLPQTSPVNLSNLSTRGLVQTGGNIMIGGFIITGISQKVVIRGLGPTLSQFGVQGILADPQLLLFNGAHQVIASNDDWQTGNQVNEIQSSGFAPAFPLESVIIATLPPGNYTAQLQGFSNTTGVALVEVYIFP
jgi:hypothetical protein